MELHSNHKNTSTTQIQIQTQQYNTNTNTAQIQNTNTKTGSDYSNGQASHTILPPILHETAILKKKNTNIRPIQNTKQYLLQHIYKMQNTNTQIGNGLGARITETVKPPYLFTSHTAYMGLQFRENTKQYKQLMGLEAL